MKPILPVVLLALLLSGLYCPHAQAQSDPAQTLSPAESKRAFNLVPANDSAYKCVDVLVQTGIAFGYPDGTSTGRDNLTRYEFAVGTARVFAVLLQHPTEVQKDLQQLQQELQDKLHKNPKAATALLALICEFEPEILALHQDVQSAKQHIFIISPFGDVPYNDPAFKALGVLQDAGLVEGYDMVLDRAGIKARSTTDTYSGNGQMTPYQFAVAVTESYPLPLPQATFAANSTQRRRAEAILAANPFALQALQSLTEEFKPILDKLGQDVPTLNSRLAALAVAPKQLPLLATKSFPDVPKDHWASQAVEAVRAAGIVAGYPAGTFRTDDTP